jgi:hypothetical protein
MKLCRTRFVLDVCLCYEGCFIRTRLSFTNVPTQLPHASSHMSGHQFTLASPYASITRRMCGGLGASVAQDLRALRLWVQGGRGLAAAGSGAHSLRTAVELHGCCARVSLAEALLSHNILTARG